MRLLLFSLDNKTPSLLTSSANMLAAAISQRGYLGKLWLVIYAQENSILFNESAVFLL